MSEQTQPAQRGRLAGTGYRINIDGALSSSDQDAIDAQLPACGCRYVNEFVSGAVFWFCQLPAQERAVIVVKWRLLRESKVRWTVYIRSPILALLENLQMEFFLGEMVRGATMEFCKLTSEEKIQWVVKAVC